MTTFEFIKYEPTPSEKHLGIATVKVYGKIILRYKIVPNKDGSGYFPCAASYKMPGNGGAEHYISAFMLDSNSENEELMSIIKANVKMCMSRPVDNQSVFSGQASAPYGQTQPNPNYGAYPQQQQPQQNYYTQTPNPIQQPQYETQPAMNQEQLPF